MPCRAVPGSSAASPSRRRPHLPHPLYTCAAQHAALRLPRPSVSPPLQRHSTQRHETPAAAIGTTAVPAAAVRVRPTQPMPTDRADRHRHLRISSEQRTVSEHTNGCRANPPQRNGISPTSLADPTAFTGCDAAHNVAAELNGVACAALWQRCETSQPWLCWDGSLCRYRLQRRAQIGYNRTGSLRATRAARARSSVCQVLLRRRLHLCVALGGVPPPTSAAWT